MTTRKLLLLVFSIGICFVAAAIGSAFTAPSIPAWYTSLQKPLFSPPNWIFGPVWTVLYFLMGVSLYLIWNSRKKSQEKRIGLAYFFLQLTINVLWSYVFFGLRSPFNAFILILCLWTAILFTYLHFRKVEKKAAWLLIPYLFWVSFATLLNFSIVLLNPK